MSGHAASMDTGCFIDASSCVHRHVHISTVSAVKFMALCMAHRFRDFLTGDKTILQGHREVLLSHPIFLADSRTLNLKPNTLKSCQQQKDHNVVPILM